MRAAAGGAGGGAAADDDADFFIGPGLPAAKATARHVLLATLKLVRMVYVCGDLINHLEVYLKRGCGAAFPPTERCLAELGALLRRNGRASALGTYLWMYAAAYADQTESHLEKAAVLRQLGDALAAADLGSLDQQLGELQEAASTTSSTDLLITSKQLRRACYFAAYQHTSNGSDTEQAAQMVAHCAST